MGKLFAMDLYSKYGRSKLTLREKIFMSPSLKYIKMLRRCQESKGIAQVFNRLRLKRLQKTTQIQIPYQAQIGGGLNISHFGRIIVNPEVVMGENVTLATGIVIGQENRGARKGSPTLGNRVLVCANAVIVGKVKIGDDVIIAPNAYVNFEVPDHSIVIGNPGKIIHKENATEGYIRDRV